MTELEFTRFNDRHDGLLHQMVHQDIDEAVLTLGMSTVPAIGLTVNIPTGHRIRDIHGNTRTWLAMGQREQILWFTQTYFPRVIAPYISRGILIFELTQKDCIHFHMIAWDESIQSRIDMAELRHTINNCVLVNSINKGRIEHAKILNCVHYLQDEPDWIAYLKKSQFQFANRQYYYPYVWAHWDPKTQPLDEISSLIIKEPEAPAKSAEGVPIGPRVPSALHIPSPTWTT